MLWLVPIIFLIINEDPPVLNGKWLAISNHQGFEPFYGPILPSAVVTLVLINANGQKAIVEGILLPSGDVSVERVIEGKEIILPAIYENPGMRNLLNPRV